MERYITKISKEEVKKLIKEALPEKFTSITLEEDHLVGHYHDDSLEWVGFALAGIAGAMLGGFVGFILFIEEIIKVGSGKWQPVLLTLACSALGFLVFGLWELYSNKRDPNQTETFYLTIRGKEGNTIITNGSEDLDETTTLFEDLMLKLKTLEGGL